MDFPLTNQPFGGTPFKRLIRGTMVFSWGCPRCPWCQVKVVSVYYDGKAWSHKIHVHVHPRDFRNRMSQKIQNVPEFRSVWFTEVLLLQLRVLLFGPGLIRLSMVVHWTGPWSSWDGLPAYGSPWIYQPPARAYPLQSWHWSPWCPEIFTGCSVNSLHWQPRYPLFFAIKSQ